MLRAYIDESGQEDKDWMFLAGFLGSEKQWEKFAPRWKVGLGPQRPYLHMHDLRWNTKRTEKLLARLGPIPEQCGLTPILGGVRYSDYQDLVSGTPLEKHLKGYIVCLFHLILQVLRTVPDDGRLEVVLEEQTRYAAFANQVLSIIADTSDWARTKDGHLKLAKWSFVPKGSTILLDPADYFSFALRELWRNKKSPKARWCSPLLESCGGKGIGMILKRSDIRAEIQGTLLLAAFDMLEGMEATG